MPTPTHSRYYSHKPEKLDPGVKKWVSMAEALRWDARAGELAVRTSMGTPKVDDRNGSHMLDPAVRPMHTLTSKSGSVIIYPTHMAASGTTCQIVDPRPVTHPARTITGAGNASFGNRATRAVGPRDKDPEARLLTPDEASTLQSYEPSFVWCGTKTKQFLQIGNAVPPLLAEAILAALIGIKRSTHEGLETA